jgi:nitronate monooxygenase
MKNRFMDWFGLTAPILQAPIGNAATVPLVEAVGRAGGMGSLAVTWTDQATGDARIAGLAAAGVPYFLNFVLRFGTASVERFLRPGLPAITLSWGIDQAIIARAKAMGVRAGVQVGSAAGARAAIGAGADFIIAQGMEGGGHVQSTTPLRLLLPRVLEAAGDTPVIAAGGIARASDIAALIKAGAQAVMMGTRFLASEEADVHVDHQRAIVSAGVADWAFTNCFDVGWPYAMHGVLRNSTLEMWEAAGSPAPPHRPGEGDIVARHGEQPIVRYCDTPPRREATGDVLACCLYAGQSAAFIDDVAPAAQIVHRLWTEAAALM